MWIIFLHIFHSSILLENTFSSWHNKEHNMIVLKERDFLEVKLDSLIADYDRDVLVNLYQPIIGAIACMIYFTLWSEANNQKVMAIISHADLFEKMKIKAKDFVQAREALEGLGLLRTFITKDKDVNFYSYHLYAPRTPKEFFDNALFYGLLMKNYGENETNKIKNLYHIDKEDNQGEEISTSFRNAFNPDFSDPVFALALKNKERMMERNKGHIAYEFSFETFMDAIKNISQISDEGFSSKEMKEIERLATLNGINEKVAADYVAKLYNPSMPKGKRVDLKALSQAFQDEDVFARLSNTRKNNNNSKVDSESRLGSKINLMESVSPKDYLSYLQGGNKPARADIKLINDISENFMMSNSVINALVDYVLRTNNNILSRPYVEKVAASLARERITNATDAMNYLYKVKTSSEKKENINEKVNEDNEESMSWDELMKELNS